MWRSTLLTAILFSGNMALRAQDVLPLFGEPTRMWTSEMNGSYNGYCLDTWKSLFVASVPAPDMIPPNRRDHL